MCPGAPAEARWADSGRLAGVAAVDTSPNLGRCPKKTGLNRLPASTVFAGQKLGIKEVDDKIWLVSFMQYDLGFFDHETGRLESSQTPFEARVLPMSPV